MSWTLQEKRGNETLKRMLLMTRAMLPGVTLLTAWLTWGVWVAVRDGERTAVSAKASCQTMIFLAAAVFAFAALQWGRSASHPPEIRRLAVWSAVTALVWAAMPLAALLTLPASG